MTTYKQLRQLEKLRRRATSDEIHFALHEAERLMEAELSESLVCNLCGESLILKGDVVAQGIFEPSGLVECSVTGGFDSTPGNGRGALDDTTKYTFSLCEFCLDWLFAQFKIPPTVFDLSDGVGEGFLPAAVRVAEDEWRQHKDRFYQEALKRGLARKARTAQTTSACAQDDDGPSIEDCSLAEQDAIIRACVGDEQCNS